MVCHFRELELQDVDGSSKGLYSVSNERFLYNIENAS